MSSAHLNKAPIFIFLILFLNVNLNFISSQEDSNRSSQLTSPKIEEMANDKEIKLFLVDTPLLIQAVEEQDLEIVQTLLIQGYNPNIQGADGETPLIAAVRVENLDMVLALLDAGADPDMENDLGETPTSIALTKIYESREEFNREDIQTQEIEGIDFLRKMSTKDLLESFTFNIINKDVLMIITALASHAPCQSVLLGKPSDYETYLDK